MLAIEAPGVTVRNLRVEAIGDGVAVRACAPQVRLENVEVSGAVLGVDGEAEDWRLPAVISLGEFAAGMDNAFAFELAAAAGAELDCRMRDVEMFPRALAPGKNRIVLKTGALRDNTILYGEILVQTANVTRRIYVEGKARMGARPGTPDRLLSLQLPDPAPMVPPAEAIAPLAEDERVVYLTRGQRLPAGELAEGTMKVIYQHRRAKPSIELDGYVFLLREDGRVRGDKDLIFFSNPNSADGAVRVASAGGFPLLTAELAKVSAEISRIAFCCSIYGEDPRENFSLVEEPIIRVFHGSTEIYRFPLADLRSEKTVVAVEVYRHKGGWKLSATGSGYRSGLRQLCEGYGVEVE